MFFPKPELPLTFQVFAVFISGLVATVSYYRIVEKLKKAGVSTPMFGNLKGLLKTFQTYRRIAPEKGWPTWPIETYWLALAVAFAAAMIVYFQPKR